MLDLQLKYIYKVLELERDSSTKDICDNLSYILSSYIDNTDITQKLIELWNYTRFSRKKEYSLSLGRGEDYKQNCMIFLTNNIFYYSKLSDCKNFSSDDTFSKGNLCKASIAFLKDDIIGIEDEINDLIKNDGFVEKGKESLIKTMHCLIDILNNDKISFQENIQFALLLDKIYSDESWIKYALITTGLIRLAKYKNRDWIIDNELVNKSLISRDFYTKTPKNWSKKYFKKELSEIVRLIEKNDPNIKVKNQNISEKIFKYIFYTSVIILILYIILWFMRI